VRLGYLLLCSVLSNVNIPQPNQPTSECLQVTRQALPGSCPQRSIDHRELLRIEVTKKCTISEIPTALFFTTDTASTGLVRDEDPRCIYRLYYGKRLFPENIFAYLYFSRPQVCSRKKACSRKNSRTFKSWMLLPFAQLLIRNNILA
jgi:hypothetical protein